MNWFLLFVILLMCGAGYFSYQDSQTELSVRQQRITDLTSKLQDATTDGQKSQDVIAQLKKDLAAANTKSDDLAAKLQAAKTELAAAQAKSAPPPPAAPPSAPAPPTFSTKLGDITTLTGKTYSNCQLLKVQVADIVISDADGITQVDYQIMTPAMQKEFGYDPKLGGLSEAQVQVLEQERAAAAAAGH